MFLLEILLLSISFHTYYVNCYLNIADIRYKGLCQFSLNGTDFKEYHFDLSRLKAKYMSTKWYEIELTTYLSMCEFYIENSVQYKNPCENGALICFINGSQLIERNFVDMFNHKPIAVSYNRTENHLNVTFEGQGHGNFNRFSNVTITLMCSETEKDPEYVGHNDQQFYYRWITPMACPVLDLDIRNKCIFTPPNKDYTYDVRDLRRDTFYTTIDKESGIKYLINMCGTIEEKACNGTFNAILCSDELSEVMVTTFDMYSLNEIENGVRISSHKKHNRKINIDLICDETVTGPYNVTVKDTQNKMLHFELKTSLSCIPPYYRCLYEDKGFTYDVTALKRYKYNYVVNSNKTHGLNFVLNMCGYLNNDSELSDAYRDGKLFAYVVNNGSRVENYNQFERLNGIGPGHLKMKYISTEKSCANDKKPWIILIHLHCASEDDVTNLRFNDTNLETCTHTLVWYTEYACPLMLYQQTDICKLEETYPTVVVYDYSFLKTKSDLKINYYDDDGFSNEFRIIVCDNLNKPCNDDTSASFCWRRQDDSEVVIGRGLSKLFDKQGEKYFQTIGDACYKNGPLSKVLLFMKCDRKSHDSLPRLVEMVKDECLFKFEWRVVSSCSPSKEGSNCNVTSHNLTQLSTGTNDYFVYINKTAYYVLSVCRSLLRNKNVLCDQDAAACIVNLYDNNTFEYRSETISSIGVDDKINTTKLSVVYSQNNLNTSTRTNYSFECYPYLVNPLITFEKIEDTHFFKWKTRYGCSNEDLRNMESKSYDTACGIVDSIRNLRVQFDGLKNKIWNVTSATTGNIYNFGICGQPRFQNCAINNGVCVRKRNGRYESGGELNSQLKQIMYNGLIKITYTDGDSCVEGKVLQRTTIVKLMYCYSPTNKIFLVDELDNCLVTIVFMSPDSCDKLQKIPCADYNIRLSNKLYLSDILPSSNKRISTDYGDLVLNLCNSDENNSINHSDYEKKVEKVERYADGTILGFQIRGHYLIGKEKLNLTFTEGSLCDFNGTSVVPKSASVLFECNARSSLLPTFMGKKGCHYEFKWSLAKMCNMSQLVLLINENHCLLKNEKSDRQVELETLANKQHMLRDDSSDIYIIDVCNRNDSSKPPSLYLFKQIGNVNISFGTPTFASIEKDVILFYSEGESCDAYSSYYGEIRLICDVTNELQPKIIERTNCSVLIEWPLFSICDNALPSTTEYIDDVTTAITLNTDHVESGSNNVITVICIMALVGSVVALILYFRRCEGSSLSVVRHYCRRRSGYRSPSNTTINNTDESEMSELSQITSRASIHNKRGPKNLHHIFKIRNNNMQ